MYYLLMCFSIGMLFFSQINAKVRILTFHCNDANFIDLQYKTFKKFMLDDYELIVFNDARTDEHEKTIRERCEKYGIQCVRYEQEWHDTDPLNYQIYLQIQDPGFVHAHISVPVHPLDDKTVRGIAHQPSVRHCHVIQYSLDNFGYNHDDVVAIVDGDAFPIRPISFRSLLRGCHITGIIKDYFLDGVDFLWVPFIAINMPSIPHKDDLKFHVDVVNNKLFDTGAHMYHYLRNHPNVVAKKHIGVASQGVAHWDKRQLQHYGFTKNEIQLIKSLPKTENVEFHVDKHMLHFGNSSFILRNHNEKFSYVKKFVDKITSSNN
jgi:hypothetical protein